MARYQVIVGNLGTVFNGNNEFSARCTFQTYAGMSKRGYGRTANEPVTLLKDDEIVKEYSPPQTSPVCGG